MSEARTPASALRLGRIPHAAWLGVGALALIGWRQGLAFAFSEGGSGNVESILFDAAENPPWLLAVVGAALLLSRARDMRAAVGAPGSPLLASLLLAPGLALLGWARFVDAPDLALLGTLAMGLGCIYSAAGGALLRIVALPLSLVAFAVPVPGVLVNQVIYPLQMATADYAHALVTALGYTTVRSADLIRTASHTFVVIEGCSGLGSMEVLTLLALAWGWQTKAPLWRCFVLALAAPVISFILNGFRVVTLVLFPDNPIWSGHTVQGVVTFAIGSLCIALLDRVLEGRRGPRAASAVPVGAPSTRPPLALFAWLGLAAALSLAVPRYTLPAIGSRDALLPETVGPWTSRALEVDRLYLGSVHFERESRRAYAADPPPPGTSRDGKPPRVEAFVGEVWHRTRPQSGRSEKNRVPGRGWLPVERSTFELRRGFHVERTIAHSESRRVLTWTYAVGLDPVPVEALRSFLALDRSPFAREGAGYVVRLSTEVLPAEKDEAFATRRIRQMFRALEPSLAGFVP